MFPLTAVGATATLRFPVKNIGREACKLQWGQAAAPFSILRSPAQVAPGATVEITASYSPVTAGAFNSILLLQSSTAADVLITVRQH